MKEPIPKPAKHFYSFGPFRLFVAERELFRGAEPVALAPKAVDTLLALLGHRGHVVDKADLLGTLWPDTFVEEDNLVQQISQLRKALGEMPDGNPYIETVPRRGYRFVADVTESWEEEAEEPRLAVVGASEQGVVDDGQRRRRPTLLAAAPWVLLVVAAGIILAMWRYWPAGSDAEPVRKFGFTAPVALHVDPGEIHADVAISPDGSHIVFNAGETRDLWTYDLERGESRLLEGTEGADDPFWAPGSDFIGFFAGSEIRKVSLRRGVPIRVWRSSGPSANRKPGGIDPNLRGGSILEP